MVEKPQFRRPAAGERKRIRAQKAREGRAGGIRNVDEIEQTRDRLEHELLESLNRDNLVCSPITEAVTRFQRVWWDFNMGMISEKDRMAKLRQLSEGAGHEWLSRSVGKDAFGREVSNAMRIRDNVQETVQRLRLDKRR